MVLRETEGRTYAWAGLAKPRCAKLASSLVLLTTLVQYSAQLKV